MRLSWLYLILLANIPFIASLKYRDEDFEEEYYDDEERTNFDTILDEAFLDNEYDTEDQEEQDENSNPTLSSCQPHLKFTHNEVEIILEKLELGLQFFENYLDQLITDGQFGLRLCQGILDNILLTLPSNNVYHTKISRLAKFSKEMGDKSLKSMKAKATKYTMQFIKIIEKPQVFYLPWKHLNELRSYIYTGENVLLFKVFEIISYE